MKYIQHKCEVEITGVSDFDLERIFECGQCFRWEADESGTYTGVAFGLAASVRKKSGSIFISGTVSDFENIWRSYFDLDLNYAEIRKRVSIDDFMAQATKHGAGIRILRQDKWEALCSFIVSQCNNIPRIKKIIATLCSEFGDEISFNGRLYYTFPTAEKIAALSENDLAPLRCGYRAAYILGASRAIVSGQLDLKTLAASSPIDARKGLKELHGVGDKVADCAMLFGLHMLDSFPLDVWMKRAVAEHYGKGFDPSIFSPYAGIAQQYIFHYVRNVRGGAKL
ncbi:MAG: DNA-3-methyladenine glycosylase 2 family protein [Oscillospiraceae bacterium]|nr:DNA-3-methyladenine glycosylase 2 family protein [Oscillospiraceae bacterium]